MLVLDRLHYKRNLLISIVISELLCIAAFLFSPDSTKSANIMLYSEPIILINNIQPTTQLPKLKRIRPTAPALVIANITEELETLDDVIVASNFSKEKDSDVTEDISVLETTNLSAAPRLTFEVIPDEKDDKISGSLNLFLKIDTDGKVISHKVLYNSIDCGKCLNKSISAAYRSKWQPGLANGIEVDYWVEKAYVFN